MANFCYSNQISEQKAFFDQEEFHHFIRVLRHQVGDRIDFLDGRGGIYRGTIEKIDRKNHLFEARIENHRQAAGHPRKLTLAIALPAKKKFIFIIQKATELGISKIIPLYSRYSLVKPFTVSAERQKLKQWQKIAVEAAKQCGNPYLPTITLPFSCPDFLTSVSPENLKILLQPHAETGFNAFAAQFESKPGVIISIGPESGFAREEERQIIAAGFSPVSLGRNILRVETAVITAIAICQYLGHYLEPEKVLKNSD